eukprot:scaffold1319_cov126-Cylindrotheca_fusiformis.AAC.2
MRARGRRVAILLATALPLLANDLGNTIPEDSISESIAKDDQDSVPLPANDAIHLAGVKEANSAAVENNVADKDRWHAGTMDGNDVEVEESVKGPLIDSSASSELEPTELLIGNTSNSSIAQEGNVTIHPQHETPEEIVDDADLKESWLNVSAEDALEPQDDKLADSSKNNMGNAVDEEDIEDETNVKITETTIVDAKADSSLDEPKADTLVQVVSKPKEITVLDEDEFKLRERVAVDYASKSAGALVIEKSGPFKGTSNLLNGDKDKYAIAPCDENKFVVISLSEDILVKVIKLANYERFSSTVKEFQVMGSQTMDTWVDLGTYTAKPGNGEQLFELLEPTWARYLKFKFLSHHGLEYYCTYSQIKVHGSTMVQGFHEQWETKEEEIPVEDSDDGNPATASQSTITQDGSGSAISLNSELEKPGNDVAATVTVDNVRAEDRLGASDTVDPSGPTEPSVCHLANPTALDATLQGKQSSPSISEKKSFFLSHLPSRSRESPGRREFATQEERTLPLSVLRDFRFPRINATTTASHLVARNLTDTITIPQMPGTVEKNMKQMMDRLAAANTPRALFSEQKKANNIQQRNVDGSVMFEGATTPENSGTDKRGNAEGSRDETNRAKPEPKERVRERETTASTVDIPSTSTESLSEVGKTEDASEVPLVGDASLAKILGRLPSSECLGRLDFEFFKAKTMRKPSSGTGTSTPVGSMEPIFKKLTDEIKALQTNLSIQDQFTKASVACYQRVLFDLILEMDKMREDHDLRLSKLEDELHSSEAFSWRLLYSISSLFSIFYSILFAWNSALLGYWVNVCSWVYVSVNTLSVFAADHLVQLCQWANAAIGNVDSDGGDKLSSLLTLLDTFFQDFRSSIRPEQAERIPEFPTDGYTLTIPIVPIVLALLGYKLIQSFKAAACKQVNYKLQPKIEPISEMITMDDETIERLNDSRSKQKDASEIDEGGYPELENEKIETLDEQLFSGSKQNNTNGIDRGGYPALEKEKIETVDEQLFSGSKQTNANEGYSELESEKIEAVGKKLSSRSKQKISNEIDEVRYLDVESEMIEPVDEQSFSGSKQNDANEIDEGGYPELENEEIENVDRKLFSWSKQRNECYPELENERIEAVD